jgi:hypothetical protein
MIFLSKIQFLLEFLAALAIVCVGLSRLLVFLRKRRAATFSSGGKNDNKNEHRSG